MASSLQKPYKTVSLYEFSHHQVFPPSLDFLRQLRIRTLSFIKTSLFFAKLKDPNRVSLKTLSDEFVRMGFTYLNSKNINLQLPSFICLLSNPYFKAES